MSTNTLADGPSTDLDETQIHSSRPPGPQPWKQQETAPSSGGEDDKGQEGAFGAMVAKAEREKSTGMEETLLSGASLRAMDAALLPGADGGEADAAEQPVNRQQRRALGIKPEKDKQPAPDDQAVTPSAAVVDLWPDTPDESAAAPRPVPLAFPPGERLKLLKLADLLRVANEPDQSVFMGFEVGEVGLVLGAPDLGKTTVTIGAAISVASGASYLGCSPAMAGPVVVATYEDKPSRVARRVIAAAQAMGADRDMVARNLHVLKCEPPSLLFRRGADGLGVEMTDKGRALLGKLRLLKAKMLVIEPLVEIHNASENENGSMHSVMAGLRLFAREGGCAVVVAHHVSRPEEKATAASSRGAGAVHAAARFALVLNTLDKDTTKRLRAAGIDTTDLIQLEIGKWNNGRKGGPMILRRRTVRVGPYSAPVLEVLPDGEDEQAA